MKRCSSRTALYIALLGLAAAAACVTPPAPTDRKGEAVFLKVEYIGRKAAGDTQLDDLSAGGRLRFLLDGTMVIEHAVSDRATTVLPLSAGTHQLVFQGVRPGGGGFSDTFEITAHPGTTATFTVLCDAYFTGQKKKNFLMGRWEKELALECVMLSSEGFDSIRQTEGEGEKNVLDTQWVQQ